MANPCDLFTMSNETWAAIIGALVGAAAGGIASFMASLYLGTGQQRREELAVLKGTKTALETVMHCIGQNDATLEKLAPTGLPRSKMFTVEMAEALIPWKVGEFDVATLAAAIDHLRHLNAEYVVIADANQALYHFKHAQGLLSRFRAETSKESEGFDSKLLEVIVNKIHALADPTQAIRNHIKQLAGELSVHYCEVCRKIETAEREVRFYLLW